jgi:hypothetical protein
MTVVKSYVEGNEKKIVIESYRPKKCYTSSTFVLLLQLFRCHRKSTVKSLKKDVCIFLLKVNFSPKDSNLRKYAILFL